MAMKNKSKFVFSHSLNEDAEQNWVTKYSSWLTTQCQHLTNPVGQHLDLKCKIPTLIDVIHVVQHLGERAKEDHNRMEVLIAG